MYELIQLIKLKGAPRERGYQHGEILADQIHSFYKKWIEVAQSCANPPGESELLEYAMKHLKFAKEYAPDLVEEVEGVAEGAKIEFEKVFLLNCYDEVSSYTPDMSTLGVVQVLGQRVWLLLIRLPILGKAGIWMVGTSQLFFKLRERVMSPKF